MAHVLWLPYNWLMKRGYIVLWIEQFFYYVVVGTAHTVLFYVIIHMYTHENCTACGRSPEISYINSTVKSKVKTTLSEWRKPRNWASMINDFCEETTGHASHSACSAFSSSSSILLLFLLVEGPNFLSLVFLISFLFLNCTLFASSIRSSL